MNNKKEQQTKHYSNLIVGKPYKPLYPLIGNLVDQADVEIRIEEKTILLYLKAKKGDHGSDIDLYFLLPCGKLGYIPFFRSTVCEHLNEVFVRIEE